MPRTNKRERVAVSLASIGVSSGMVGVGAVVGVRWLLIAGVVLLLFGQSLGHLERFRGDS